MYALIDTFFFTGSFGTFIYGCMIKKGWVIGTGIGSFLIYPIIL